MSNQQCPNCGEYKYKKEVGSRKAGCWLIAAGLGGGFLLGGAAGAFGGVVEMNLIFLIISGLLFLFGLFLFVTSFLPGDEGVTYNCSNCNYRDIYDSN